jgi:hypothetical protein
MARNPPRKLLTAAEWRARHLGGTPPRIWADSEVRDFIDAHLPTMTFSQLAGATLEAFGKPRAPSRSAIARYWKRVASLRPDAVKPSGSPPDRP